MAQVYIDTSEKRDGSKLPSIPEAIELPFLEALTGADIMITTEGIPVSTEHLLLTHIRKGALLVQRKHGADLHNSVGVRMNESLAKMIGTGAKQSQCVLLLVELDFSVTTEWFSEDEIWSVFGAISKWHDRGGVVESLPKAEYIETWIKMKISHMLEYKKEPIKKVYPEKPEITSMEGALQLPQLINDGRVTLATLPNIGVKRAEALWETFNGNLGDALIFLSTPPSPMNKKRVHGVGDGTIKAVREWLGIGPYSTLGYNSLPVEKRD